MREPVLRLVFPAHARYLVLARLSLTGLAPVAQLRPAELADLKLAVTEACANAIRHAYPDGAEGTVCLRIAVDESEIEVEVADAGTGFEPTTVPPAEHDEGPDRGERNGERRVDRVGGMGLAIIRSVVDELEIGRRVSGGTFVRFRKRLAAA
jgi:serine/threonine-protein kinase RsbW